VSHGIEAAAAALLKALPGGASPTSAPTRDAAAAVAALTLALRAILEEVQHQSTRDEDRHGSRVTNAGDAISSNDYVTKRQLDVATTPGAAGGADPTPESGWRKVNAVVQLLEFADAVLVGSPVDAGTIAGPGLTVREGVGVRSNSDAVVTVNNSINTGNGGRLFLFRARGSLAGPTAVQSGNEIGAARFDGHDGSDFFEGASVTATANQNWSGSARGTRLEIATAKDGATSATTLLQIKNGTVALGEGIATNATTGFAEIPSCAGTPTGVPVVVGTNTVPMVYDRTGNVLYIYSNGAWRTH
jgi:hypothetical protein